MKRTTDQHTVRATTNQGVNMNAKQDFDSVLLEDISILVNSSFVNSEERDMLLSSSEAESMYDFEIAVYMSVTSTKRHMAQWKDTPWDFNDKDQRMQHRSWVRWQIKTVIRDIRTRSNHNPLHGAEGMALIDTYTTEFEDATRDELVFCLSRMAQTPLHTDIYLWKMGMITCEQIMSKHNFSRATLNRKLVKFKEVQAAYLLSYRNGARVKAGEFDAEISAMNEWFAHQEPSSKF